MRGERQSLLAGLDDAVEAVLRRAPGWAGVALLAALPLRFLEVHFFNRVAEIGSHAAEYGRYLTSLSILISLALPLAFWGRAVLAHAVVLSLTGERRVGRQALRLPAGALLAGFYAFLAAQLLELAFAFTGVGIAAGMVLSGLAVATVPLQATLGPWAPLRAGFGQPVPLRITAGTFLLTVIAYFIALLNLAALFALGLWMAGGLPGGEVIRWQALLSWSNRHFVLVLAAGAALAVEPFWIAGLTVAVHQARARQSGEDLRAWFAEIRTAGPA